MFPTANGQIECCTLYVPQRRARFWTRHSPTSHSQDSKRKARTSTDKCMTRSRVGCMRGISVPYTVIVDMYKQIKR